MNFFLMYLKKRRAGAAAFAVFCAVFLCAFILYGIPVGAVVYPALVCLCLGIIACIIDFIKARKKHKILCEIIKLPAQLIEALPQAASQDELDYQEIIMHLKEEARLADGRFSAKFSDMVDYYTTWAHQIKTPIASMRLTLQNEDSPLARTISGDLFRIEQYVEMVLCYLRLDSDSTDYVIQRYELDAVLTQAFRRFSGQFIQKKLRLDYEPPQFTALTDEKWLLFVIEQILANAVKYTPPGGVISVSERQGVLCIKDNGIGIAEADLPRIFERGYTGFNGRADKKVSGLGLYLCKRICRSLNHRIWAESGKKGGTAVYIDLNSRKIKME